MAGLDDIVARCRQAFPGLDVPVDAFARHVAARCPPELALATWTTTMFAEDLFLACGCLAGVPGALATFDARHGADIDRVLRGTDRRGLDDAKQVLQQRLFVGAAPKIASYSGRGPLRRWLRVVVGRLLLEVLHAREPLADDWEIAALPVATDNPELAYLKARYRAAYKQAFADALAQLGDRDRTVLAQYHVDSLTIDELGAVYGVHRVTASRWVLKAEAQVRDGVLALLRARLGLSTEDLREVTQLVRSQLSLSLARTLGPPPPGDDF